MTRPLLALLVALALTPPTVYVPPDGPDVIVESHARERARLRVMAWSTAERYGIDPALVFAVIEVESGWRADLVHINSDGTRDWGLMQLNDRTWPWLAERVGLRDANPLRPEDNVQMGVWLLAYLSRKYGPDPHRVLGAYNMGESGYRRYTASRGTTRSAYSTAVLRRAR